MISVGTGVFYTPVPICFLDSLIGRNSMRNCSAKGAAPEMLFENTSCRRLERPLLNGRKDIAHFAALCHFEKWDVLPEIA